MKKLLLTLAGLALASLAMGELSKYKDWAKSPEAYFLTPSERDEWSKVKSDDEAEKFIALYWTKRDPTPSTAQNEFKEAVTRRIAAADEQFKMRRYARGAESVRGRVFIVLGPPTRASQARAQERDDLPSGSTIGSIDTRAGSSRDANVVAWTWIYEKERFDPSWGLGMLTARFSVDPQRGSDELSTRSEVERAIAKVSEKSIVNPGGQTAQAPAVAGVRPAIPPAATGPKESTAPASPAASAAPPPPPVSATLPAANRSALELILKENKEQVATFWGGPFRTVTGDPFYAFQFYVPGDKAPAGALKFGGVVTSASGGETASFWEDAALSDMKTGQRTDKVYERSMVLPAGSYKTAFALFPADGAAPLVSSSASFQIGGKTSDFYVSPLILANTLTPMTKRPNPTDPFVFGMEKPIRVEPKGNGIFAKEDSLWYFYTVANPSLPAPSAPASAEAPASAKAPAGETAGKPVATPAPAAPGAPPAAAPAPAEPKPRIMARIGVLKDGKAAFAPFSGPAELQVLSPGYYATGSEIPLASFEPGYYTFNLNVRDLAAPRDSAAFKGVDRKEDFVVLKPDGSMPEKAVPAAPKPTPKPKAPAKKG